MTSTSSRYFKRTHISERLKHLTDKFIVKHLTDVLEDKTCFVHTQILSLTGGLCNLFLYTKVCIIYSRNSQSGITLYSRRCRFSEKFDSRHKLCSTIWYSVIMLIKVSFTTGSRGNETGALGV